MAAALVALAGCSSSGDDASQQADAAPTSDVPASVGQFGETPYIRDLFGIDEKLTDDETAALDKGKSICLDLSQGKGEATVEKNTAARFKVGADQAEEIVDTTKTVLCSVISPSVD